MVDVIELVVLQQVVVDLLGRSLKCGLVRGVPLDGGHRIEQSQKGGLIPGGAGGCGSLLLPGAPGQQQEQRQQKGKPPHYAAFSTKVWKSPMEMVTEAARSASEALPSSVTAMPPTSAGVLPVA